MKKNTTSKKPEETPRKITVTTRERLLKWLPFVLISLAFFIIYYTFNHRTALIADDIVFSYVYNGPYLTVDAKPLEHVVEIFQMFRPHIC